MSTLHRDDVVHHLRLVDPSAPMPWIEESRLHYNACVSGPCKKGTKICPSPEACRLPLTEGGRRTLRRRRVSFILKILLVGAIIVAALVYRRYSGA